MLVLSRHRDESIQIGDGVTITIVDIRGDKVRIGVEAPQDMQIHRREVWEAIKRLDSGTKPLGGTDAGKDASRNATQARTDPQQYAD